MLLLVLLWMLLWMLLVLLLVLLLGGRAEENNSHMLPGKGTHTPTSPASLRAERSAHCWTGFC